MHAKSEWAYRLQASKMRRNPSSINTGISDLPFHLRKMEREVRSISTCFEASESRYCQDDVNIVTVCDARRRCIVPLKPRGLYIKHFTLYLLYLLALHLLHLAFVTIVLCSFGKTWFKISKKLFYFLITCGVCKKRKYCFILSFLL